MAGNFITGMSQGFQAGQEMIYGPAQEQAKTQLLSTQAQSAQLALTQQKEEYTARIGAMATEQQVAKANADLDVTTSKGRLQLLQKSLTQAKDDPEQSQYILNQIKNESSNYAASLKDQASIAESTSIIKYDAVASALTNNDPASWDVAIAHAEGPAKDILTQVKAFHQSPEYQKFPAGSAERQQLDKQILMNLAPEKAAATMLNQQATQAYRQQQLQIAQERADSQKRAVDQRAAIKREGDTIKDELARY